MALHCYITRLFLQILVAMPSSLLCHFLSVPKGGIVSKFDCTSLNFLEKPVNFGLRLAARKLSLDFRPHLFLTLWENRVIQIDSACLKVFVIDHDYCLINQIFRYTRCITPKRVTSWRGPFPCHCACEHYSGNSSFQRIVAAMVRCWQRCV